MQRAAKICAAFGAITLLLCSINGCDRHQDNHNAPHLADREAFTHAFTSVPAAATGIAASEQRPIPLPSILSPAQTRAASRRRSDLLANISRARLAPHPVPLSECATLLRDVTVSRTRGLIFRNYSGTPSLSVPVCQSISPKPQNYRYELKDNHRRCEDAHDVVLIAHLSRPQHAMQFLFALVSVIALQVDLDIDIDRVPAIVSVMSYGKVGTWTDFTNIAAYPHIELMQLLSRKAVTQFADQTYARWALIPAQPDDAWLALASRDNLDEIHAVAAVYGTVPLRVPRVKVQGAIRREHFEELRFRIAERFALPLETDPVKHLVVLVHREPQYGRQVLNADELRRSIASATGSAVLDVYWERLTLAEQLTIAVNAKVMVGAHGNGLAWACLMPKGSLMVELGSTVGFRNELVEGVNEANPGNVASLCGVESLSLRCAWTHNVDSRRAPPTRVWKSVDVSVGPEQLARIEAFLDKRSK